MKFSRILLTSAALLALSLGQANAAEVKKIGLAVANLQANFFNQIKQAVEAEAKTRGIAVVTVDAKGDGPTQVNQIQDLLTQNIDALIYIPAGAAAATVPVKLAKAAGVPVINIDRNADGAPGDTFLATDSVASAKAGVPLVSMSARDRWAFLIAEEMDPRLRGGDGFGGKVEFIANPIRVRFEPFDCLPRQTLRINFEPLARSRET